MDYVPFLLANPFRSVSIPSLELLQVIEVLFSFSSSSLSLPSVLSFPTFSCCSVPFFGNFLPFFPHLAACAAPHLSLLRFHWTERPPGEPAGHKNHRSQTLILHSRDQLKEKQSREKIKIKIPSLQNPTLQHLQV